jgi:hypothetical protein
VRDAWASPSVTLGRPDHRASRQPAGATGQARLDGRRCPVIRSCCSARTGA